MFLRPALQRGVQAPFPQLEPGLKVYESLSEGEGCFKEMLKVEFRQFSRSFRDIQFQELFQPLLQKAHCIC